MIAAMKEITSEESLALSDKEQPQKTRLYSPPMLKTLSVGEGTSGGDGSDPYPPDPIDNGS